MDRNGGAEIELQIKDETFRFWATDSSFIARARTLKESGKPSSILFDQLVNGAGRDPGWTFHVEAASISWLDLATSGCDARPSEIERDKTHWVEEVKRWCPWSVQVRAVEDCF